MWRTPGTQFILCVQNGGNDDLIPRKIYEILPDRKPRADGLLRVIDESGEDYLYPAELFAKVTVPPEAKRALVATP